MNMAIIQKLFNVSQGPRDSYTDVSYLSLIAGMGYNAFIYSTLFSYIYNTECNKVQNNPLNFNSLPTISI